MTMPRHRGSPAQRVPATAGRCRSGALPAAGSTPGSAALYLRSGPRHPHLNHSQPRSAGNYPARFTAGTAWLLPGGVCSSSSFRLSGYCVSAAICAVQFVCGFCLLPLCCGWTGSVYSNFIDCSLFYPAYLVMESKRISQK